VVGLLRDESVDLIYLDPPFNSKAGYNVLFKAPTGEHSQVQIEAFEDTVRLAMPEIGLFGHLLRVSIAARDMCDGTSAVGESRHRIPGASVGQPTEPCSGAFPGCAPSDWGHPLAENVLYGLLAVGRSLTRTELILIIARARRFVTSAVSGR
jgi:hypothetical protein